MQNWLNIESFFECGDLNETLNGSLKDWMHWIENMDCLNIIGHHFVSIKMKFYVREKCFMINETWIASKFPLPPKISVIKLLKPC